MPHHIRRSHGHKPQRRAHPSCNTGGFYTSPTTSQSIDYATPVNISWDTTCLNSTNVDIFLYAPGTGSSRIHAWQSVYFPAGSYQTLFQPKWWNSTASMNLQLSIVPSGTPTFLSPYPAGPIFTVKYQRPSSGTPASADTSKPDSAVTVVKNAPTSNHLSGGKLAAAVFMPLFIIVLLLTTAYIKLKRERGREVRKRWSEAIDKRMSTISTDWKPISAAGAQAAIRNSMAIDGSVRNSSAFSFGSIRPDSTIVEGGQAGIGSRARTVLPGQSNGVAQLRSSPLNTTERVSRVSFAPDVRPSTESRRTTAHSRAYHTAIVPPLPDRNWEITTPNTEGDMSPTQTDGPQTLSIEDIQARLAGKDTGSRPSVDAVMPALRMMRTSDSSPGTQDDELLFSAQSESFPAVPSPTHSNPLSPEPASAMSSFMPMQPMPANVMSPDDMLRAYAERRAAAAAGGPAVPSPAYTGVGAQGGMRTLYSPTATTDRHSTRRTTIGSQYSAFADEDAYGGTL